MIVHYPFCDYTKKHQLPDTILLRNRHEIKHKYPLIMAHENDNEKYEITEDMATTMYYHCMSGTLIQIPSSPNVYLPIYKFKMLEEQYKTSGDR